MEHWVAFPGLGIEPFSLPRSVVEFDFLGRHFDIRWYGLLITIGLVLAMAYAYRQAPRLQIDRDRMIDVVLVCFVVAIVCTRLYYVIFYNPAYYFSNPAEILAIWDGGLAIYGGIIGAFVSGFIMCRVKKVSVTGLFDLAAIGFLMGQGIGRWGNFFNQEAYGAETTLPWGMIGDDIGQTPVHPTFLYESLWCLLGVLVMHLMFKKCYKFRGQIFASYLIWYGIERVFVEGLRQDSLYIPGTAIRVSQVVSGVAIVLGIVLLIALHKRSKKLSLTTDAGEIKTLDIAPDETAEESVEEATVAEEETAEEPTQEETE